MKKKMPPLDETFKSGEDMSSVLNKSDLTPGTVIRIWHDALEQWIPGSWWSEVVRVQGDRVYLKDLMTGEEDNRDISDTISCSWKHPHPERLKAFSKDKESTRGEVLKEVEITTGKKFNKGSSNPESKDKRAGKCKTCGTIFKLTDAKEVCLDWESSDAYHYYCPICYKGTNGYNYYTGQLLGNDGEHIIDQYFK